MPDIDTLSIQITANSSSATKSLNALSKAVEKLKTATSGGFGNLSRLKNNISKLAESLEPLQGMADATKAINAVARLPKALEGLSNANMQKFTANLEKFTQALDPLLSKVKDAEGGLTALAQVMKVKYPQGTTKATKGTISLAAQLGAMYIKFKAIYFIGQRVTQMLSKMTSESMKYQETLNLYRIAMGSYYEEGLSYAKKVQNSLGIDAAEWLKYQAVFMNMAKGFGIVTENAEIMSRNLTQIGYDLASVFNVDFETAMQKLESGISGQPRPMREWGFDMSEATLKMVALNKGITKNVENMTQAEKAQLRYIQIYETVQKLGIEGDLARTLQTPANALRVFQSNVTLAARAIGNIMIPVLNQLLPRLTAMAKAVAEIANQFSKWTGFTITEIDYSGLENAVTGVDEELTDATEQAEKLKSAIMGFDELNVISPNNNGSGTGNDLGDILNLDLPDNVNWLVEGLSQNIDELVPKMKEVAYALASVIATLTTLWGSSKIIEGFAKIKTAMQTLNLTGVSPLVKGIAGVGGLVTSFFLAKQAGEELADSLAGDDDGSVLSGCIALVGSVGMGAASGATFGGGIGAVIGGLLSLAGTIISMTAKIYQNNQAMGEMKAWAIGSGTAFINLRTAVQNFFKSLDQDAITDWNNKIKDATDNLDGANKAYSDLWFTLDTKSQWNSDDIDSLAAAFENLVTAIKELNEVKIGSLLSSLNTAITQNITPELAGRFKDLAGQVVALQDAINREISSLSGTYMEVLDRIAENGGIVTQADKDQLSDIASKMTSLSVGGNYDLERFMVDTEAAITKSTVIGTNKSEVESNINSLLEDYNTYAKALQDNYAENRATLKRLIEIDETQYHGAFGLSKESDLMLQALDDAYNAQLGEAQRMMRDTLSEILLNYNTDASAQYEAMQNLYNAGLGTGLAHFIARGDVMSLVGNGLTNGAELEGFGTEMNAVNEWLSGLVNSFSGNGASINVYVDGQQVAAIVDSNNINAGARTSGNGAYINQYTK